MRSREVGHAARMEGERQMELCATAAERIVPHDDRAFGSAYQKALRRGEIRVVGHCRRLTVWRDLYGVDVSQREEAQL